MKAGYGLRATGYGGRLSLMFVLMACSGGSDGDNAGPQPTSSKDGILPSAKAGEPLGVRLDWQKRLPSEPGVTVLRSVAGPAVAGDVAVFGATGMGWVAVDVGTGEVVWRLEGEERPSRAAASGSSFLLYGECTSLSKVPEGDVVGCVREVSAASGSVIGAVEWLHSPRDPPCVASPIRVVNEELRGSGWKAEDRFHAVVGYAPDGWLAIRLTGGIGPVVVSEHDGSIVAEGDSTPGLQVLSYTRTSTGLAIAVRRDSTLFNDAIVHFGRDNRLTWAWPLPRPQQARVEPVGVAPSGHGVVAFYDGRFAAHLSVENSNTVTP